VENLISEEYARALATDNVVNATFAQLVDAQRYRVVGNPAFDEETLVVEGEDFTYVVTFKTRPQLELKDAMVSAKMPPREATETEVDARIDSIRARFAQLKKARSRKIRKDDYVLLSFTSTVDGEDYEGSAVERYVYQMGQGMMPPEFEENIVGAKPGETVVAEFILQDSGDNSEFAGKTIHFDIELHEIQEQALPEVNDELAVMSGFADVAEMREEIAASITSSKENSYQNVQSQRLVAALAEKLEGDIPQELVDGRAEHLKRDFADMLGKNNMTIEQYLAMSSADPAEFETDIATQAHIAISEELALEALARKENLEPTDADIEVEMRIIAEQSNMSIEAARKRWEEAALMTTLRDELARRNAVAWLIDNSEIIIDEEAF
jgi:trigger factor